MPIKKYKLKKEEIVRLIDWHGADGCLATDMITVEGKRVGYMYREEPANALDCGWRFFEGNETEEYLSVPDNAGVYNLNTICNYDRDIIPFLHSQIGSAFERDQNGVFVPVSWEDPF